MDIKEEEILSGWELKKSNDALYNKSKLKETLLYIYSTTPTVYGLLRDRQLPVGGQGPKNSYQNLTFH